MSRSHKGTQYEREICRLLSEWWSKGRSDSVFWRTKGSGGRATVRSRKGKQTDNQCGDVYAVEQEGFPLTNLLIIELKRGYNRFSIMDLVSNPDRNELRSDGAMKKKWHHYYDEWISKAITSTQTALVFSWILIVRSDRAQALVYMPWNLVKALKENGAFKSRPKPFVTFQMDIRFKTDKGFEMREVKLSCMLLKDFLNCVTPNMIRHMEKYY